MGLSNYLENVAASGYEVTITEVASHKSKIRIRVKPDTEAIAKRKVLLENFSLCMVRFLERSFNRR